MKPAVSRSYPPLAITHPGAYLGTGLGTGGFGLLFQRKYHHIDSLDSTGLYYYQEKLYRFVRPNKSLVIYNTTGIEDTLYLPQISDAHDIHVSKNHIVIVSAGNNTVFWIDHSGRTIRSWTAPGEGDSWHLNCLLPKQNNLYVSAFGQFSQHRQWNFSNQQKTGLIYDLTTHHPLLTHLDLPHHPRLINNNWYILNSHSGYLSIFSHNRVIRKMKAGSFPRGFAYNDKFLFIGNSCDRKISPSNSHTKLLVFERSKLIISDQIDIPQPEIYDIVAIPTKFAKSIIQNPHLFAVKKTAHGSIFNRIHQWLLD